MSLQEILNPSIKKAAQELFEITIEKVEFQSTRKDFEGDITVVIFPLLKLIKGPEATPNGAKLNPAEIGTKIGTYLVENVEQVIRFNVVAGFLNIVVSDSYYVNFFNTIKDNNDYGKGIASSNDKAILVEYSSPNTNKPLHLGHVRNNLLGYSVAEIIKASGKKVYKTQIINDRGIHICKSMLAWQKFGNGQTPENSGLKGDKLVGNFYVMFEKELKLQTEPIFNQYRKSDFTTNMTVSASTIKAHNNLIENLESQKSSILENTEFGSLDFLNDVITLNLKELTFEFNFSQIYNELKKSGKEEEIRASKEFKEFDKLIKPIIAIEEKISDNISKIYDFAKQRTEIMGEAQEMLRNWEAGKPEVMQLWKAMNQWVYDGFATTYKSLGVDFDSYYYESNTYLLGKEVVQLGLEKGIFEKDADGSVWIDLTPDGLDRKIVLRSDGTAVYMTQDIGTAIQRSKDFPDVGGMVYTVGNEQDYHFKVLFLILKKLGFDWASNLYHLSYGMVELPSGKMKSREGTVVDADDLMEEMTATAQNISEELGKLEGYSDEEKSKLYKTIGLGALKYFMLKVDPKKSMMFNPEESVDFAGNTGPFIQYTYARIQSILRKANFETNRNIVLELHPKEKELLKQIELFPEVIQNAASHHSPALVANYTYDLVKEFNSFYQNVSILGEENQDKKVFRVQLSSKVSEIIKLSFSLLGIEVPERM